MRSAVGSLILWGVAMSASLGATGKPVEEPSALSAHTVAVQRVATPAGGLRDETAMVLVGAALIGLAAAVRRAA